MADFVGAVDQGTTSTRFMIFDHGGNEVARHQLEHEQILPQAGWVEHNPTEIWERTRAVIETAMHKANLHAADLAALGITNQRETTVVWNQQHRAAVLQRHRLAGHPHRPDRRRAGRATGAGDVIRRKAGLPPATYFSGGKIQWILENVDGVRAGGRGRRRHLRQHRQLAAVEPHRRRRTAACTSPTSPTPAARC